MESAERTAVRPSKLPAEVADVVAGAPHRLDVDEYTHPGLPHEPIEVGPAWRLDRAGARGRLSGGNQLVEHECHLVGLRNVVDPEAIRAGVVRSIPLNADGVRAVGGE